MRWRMFDQEVGGLGPQCVAGQKINVHERAIKRYKLKPEEVVALDLWLRENDRSYAKLVKLYNEDVATGKTDQLIHAWSPPPGSVPEEDVKKKNGMRATHGYLVHSIDRKGQVFRSRHSERRGKGDKGKNYTGRGMALEFGGYEGDNHRWFAIANYYLYIDPWCEHPGNGAPAG